MKVSKLVMRTLREAPADAQIASHALMIRADLVRKLANGLYSYMPLGLKAKRKVEKVIREELDRAGFNEISCSVIVPAALWEKSGRFDKMAGEMLSCDSRGGQKMVVSPTCEEAFTELISSGLASYKDLPLTTYQINEKYRDEIRPRYGVMRAREFTMMDAYSFNIDDKDLDETYKNFSICYERIFRRLGLKTITVRASTGAMGGSASEEFMVASPVGDDTLEICPKCGYAANQEKATCYSFCEDGDNIKKEKSESEKTPAIENAPCPGVESIAEMENFFKMPATRFIKVLLYKVENSSYTFPKDCNTKVGNAVYVAVAIRGDLDVNESKLSSALQAPVLSLADAEDVIKFTGTPHGFVGPTSLKKGEWKVPLIVDESVVWRAANGDLIPLVHDATTGSGTKDLDLRHVEPLRDFTPDDIFDLRLVVEGDLCPQCRERLTTKKGNELGHIFKLGDKYTKALGVTYLDQSGHPKTPIMGCYGIGIDRTLASIIEECHDDKGIIWPVSVAPFQVIIVPIAYKGDQKAVCDSLYDEMKKKGIDVLLDDRNERPGVKFCDADLIGIPIRVVVSERNLPNVEVKLRRDDGSTLVDKGEVANHCAALIARDLSSFDVSDI